MPSATEYKFITTRLSGFARAPSDAKYFNWADVAEMLTRYGSDGWRVSHMTATEVEKDSVLYSFVLERPAAYAQRKRT